MPSFEVDKASILIRPESSAYPIVEDRKRGRSHSGAGRYQRPRVESPEPFLSHGAGHVAAAAYGHAHAGPTVGARSPSRGRSANRQPYLRVPPAAAVESLKVSHLRSE